jgi:hypothetical protein
MINIVRVDEQGVVLPLPLDARVGVVADTVDGLFTDVEDGDPDGPADEIRLDVAIL